MRLIYLLILILISNQSIGQNNQNYVRWSLNLQELYIIQKDVGVNSSTSYFNFQNTWSSSAGLSYQVIQNEQFTIGLGFNFLYFAPKFDVQIKSNGVKPEFSNFSFKEYEDFIWRIPITYKGNLLEFIGLNETMTLNYNIPNYRYDSTLGLRIDNELIYELNSKADKNFFSTALGINKSITTKAILFDVAGGFSFDLNKFLDGTVELGDGTIQNYNLVTNGPYLNLSISPKKFKIVRK